MIVEKLAWKNVAEDQTLGVPGLQCGSWTCTSQYLD